jgi:hypothetical protein
VRINLGRAVILLAIPRPGPARHCGPGAGPGRARPRGRGRPAQVPRSGARAAGDRPELAGPGRARRPRSAGRLPRAGRPRSAGGDRLTTTRRRGIAAAGRSRLAVVAGPASRGGLVRGRQCRRRWNSGRRPGSDMPEMATAGDSELGPASTTCARAARRPRTRALRPAARSSPLRTGRRSAGCRESPARAACQWRRPAAAGPRACHKSYRIGCCSPEVLRSPWMIRTAGDGVRINRNRYRCDESESTGFCRYQRRRSGTLGHGRCGLAAQRIVARISTGFRGAL